MDNINIILSIKLSYKLVELIFLKKMKIKSNILLKVLYLAFLYKIQDLYKLL